MKFKGFLWQTLKVQTTSRHTEAMQEYILEQLNNFSPDEVYHEQSGNIVALKGNAMYYPTIVAHMDTVHDVIPAKKWKPTWRQGQGKISAPTGIGGDDKVGVALALWLFKIFPVIKVIFTVDEEIGGLGAEALDVMHLENIAYMLQADRRGQGDIILDYMGSSTANKLFTDTLTTIGQGFNYLPESGIFTDVMILGPVAGVSVANLSCGYYNPHSSREYVVVKDVLNTLGYMQKLYQVLGVDKQYTHKWEEEKSYVTQAWTRASYQDDYLDGVYVPERSFSQDYDIINLLEEIYDTDQSPAFEWLLYHSQLGENVIESMVDDSAARSIDFEDYLFARFYKEIEDVIVSYNKKEMTI